MAADILAIDIGGTSIKTAVLDSQGKLLSKRLRVPTPHPCPPDLLVSLVTDLVQDLPAFERISIGFPGVIRKGRILTAANLQSEKWFGYDLAQALSARLGGCPARILNDADMIGLALIAGQGIELVVTLGTGFGSALFRNGDLMPHMELAHHPVADNRTYDQYLGDAELKRIGKLHWNDRIGHALGLLNTLFHPDHILLSGGNARNIDVALPPNAQIMPDAIGIAGGAALWREDNQLSELFSG
ncbi:ROK family protein [Halopseudomonas sp.]|uniref:ROK family protein n=1 Tax=Halopseudomonas sp. TaxID=2901191 RepID=UPI0035658B98